LGDVRGLVNINLIETDGWELVGESFEDGTDHPTWATPGCPKVDGDDLVLVGLVINRPEKWRFTVSSFAIPGAIMIRWTYDLPELFKGSDWGDGHGDLERWSERMYIRGLAESTVYIGSARCSDYKHPQVVASLFSITREAAGHISPAW
jgi:hypothetical protein